MTPEKKKQLLNDVFALVMLIAVLVIIVRLWPILLLLLIGLLAYALWMLFHVAKQPVKIEPIPLPMLPAPVSEQSLFTTAFGLLQRRITEEVLIRYPDARWVWGVPDAFHQFSSGGVLTILLNGAGGYQKAIVQVRDLQFVGLSYGPEPSDSETPQVSDKTPEEERPTEVDYGLLAFEWAEANLQRLNMQSNEVIAAGQDGFRIPAEELPHGDSWPTLCTELIRSGFAAAEPLANGIQVKIKTE